MSNALANLTTKATDTELVLAITANILGAENPAGPFRLGYEFPGNDGPPPIQGHDVVRQRTLCVVELTDRRWSRDWIAKCLLAGLRVQRFTGRGWHIPIISGSIQEARNTLEARERMAAFDATRTLPDYDDEIPF